MPQSLAQIYLHVVYSTKNRMPLLRDPTLADRMHRYLAGACNELQSPCLIAGGAEDHVHLLCRLSKGLAVCDFIRELKRESSKWIKSEGVVRFSWQNGYGAFSVSPSHVESLRNYIANQREHHRRETFQDEFRRLLRKYGIEYDERYVWD